MTDPDYPYDASPSQRRPFFMRARRELVAALLVAAAGVVVFWDLLILPVYAGARLHVTVVPLLMVGLGATVLFWLFVRIKKNTHDPVRRHPRAAIAGLIGFLGLNLGALLLFEQGWSFISAEARWAGIALVVVNVHGAWVLFYLFGMRWNRTPGTRKRIHDAVVESLGRAPVWHEPSPYLKRKEASGWRHTSSVYAYAVYVEFARAYEAALEHLQHHLTRLQLDLWHRQHAAAAVTYNADALPRALATPLEPCLKAGNALVSYLAFFDDVNGHRGWMAHEIAWRMLNVKLLHLAACLAALPEAATPSETLHTDLADLKRLYRLYQSQAVASEDDAAGPLRTLAVPTGPWRAAALQNRLCRLFLTGLYHTRHHEELGQRWAALWQRPLGYMTPAETEPPTTKPPAAGLPVFFDEVAPVWMGVQALRGQGVRLETWQAEHFFRYLTMHAGLPTPLTRFLDALTALVEPPPTPREDPAPSTRLAVPGFDAAGLEDDLTALLVALPHLDAQDINETDFRTLWANATVLWMLEDLVFFERTLSSVQFKDILQDALWERTHPQIRAAARRLMQTPRSRQRWCENQASLARRTNDPTLTLHQTWERVPLAS